jgi:hypothetical protein
MLTTTMQDSYKATTLDDINASNSKGDYTNINED